MCVCGILRRPSSRLILLLTLKEIERGIYRQMDPEYRGWLRRFRGCRHVDRRCEGLWLHNPDR
ncbi:hypothetical protein D3C71_1849010 [compost metagenome]